MVLNCLVPNSPGAKLSVANCLVPNCPVPNCPGAKLSYKRLYDVVVIRGDSCDTSVLE